MGSFKWNLTSAYSKFSVQIVTLNSWLNNDLYSHLIYHFTNFFYFPLPPPPNPKKNIYTIYKVIIFMIGS